LGVEERLRTHVVAARNPTPETWAGFLQVLARTNTDFGQAWGVLHEYWGMRCRSADGQWQVDVILLSLTSDNRDGEWLRVSRWGLHVGDVRTVDELREYVDLADLEEALEEPRSACCTRMLDSAVSGGGRAGRSFGGIRNGTQPKARRGGARFVPILK
jgi:hypothetical protein